MPNTPKIALLTDELKASLKAMTASGATPGGQRLRVHTFLRRREVRKADQIIDGFDFELLKSIIDYFPRDYKPIHRRVHSAFNEAIKAYNDQPPAIKQRTGYIGGY